MKRKIVLFMSILLLGLSGAVNLRGQCSMCAANAEASEAHKNKATVMGLNTGILYIMILPYAAIGAAGFWWYKNYKKKSV